MTQKRTSNTKYWGGKGRGKKKRSDSPASGLQALDQLSNLPNLNCLLRQSLLLLFLGLIRLLLNSRIKIHGFERGKKLTAITNVTGTLK